MQLFFEHYGTEKHSIQILTKWSQRISLTQLVQTLGVFWSHYMYYVHITHRDKLKITVILIKKKIIKLYNFNVFTCTEGYYEYRKFTTEKFDKIPI